MSLESNQRSTVVRILSPLHAISAENVCPGFPDVVFIGGVLELKTADRWPVRADSVLTAGVMNHPKKGFTPQQRVFALKRRRAQGFHCVCLQVDHDWFLIPGELAAKHLGVDWTRADIIKGSWRHWLGGLNKNEFYNAIVKATEKSRGWNPYE